MFTCNTFHKIRFIGKLNQRVYMQYVSQNELQLQMVYSISREESG